MEEIVEATLEGRSLGTFLTVEDALKAVKDLGAEGTLMIVSDYGHRKYTDFFEVHNRRIRWLDSRVTRKARR